MRKALKLLIVTLLLIGISGCSVEVNKVKSEDTLIDKVSTETKWANEETNLNKKIDDKAIEALLEEVGVDTSVMDKRDKTEAGLNVMGAAKPAKSFPSLGLAEDAFKDYLGFHNKMENIEGDFELTEILIIDKDILYGVYESEELGETIKVKLTKELEVEELLESYKNEEEDQIEPTSKGEVLGIEVNTHKNDIESDKTNLMWFNGPNNKKYTIHTDKGLDREAMEKLLTELIWNVSTMPEWDGHR